MKIVVTGAGGQLGSEWARYLQQKNIEHYALSSSRLDITDRNALFDGLNRLAPDRIINCAAWTDVDGTESRYEEALKVNAEGVENLAAWCAGNEARLVHYSTDYVFSGRREDARRYPAGYPETAAPEPVNRYGETKLAGEKSALESGASVLLIRVSWLCGVSGDNFLNTMLQLAMAGRGIRVVNDQFGSPTWADEVPEFTTRLLDRGEEGIFHLSSGGRISWFELASELFREAGMEVALTPVTSEEYPTQAARPAFSKLDTRKLSEVLEERPNDWHVGLKRFVQSWLERGGASQ